MISLSRIIKMANYRPSEDSVLLSVTPVPFKTEQSSERLQENIQIINQAEIEAKTIIIDAEETAQKILQQASEQAEQMKEQVQEEINSWWEQKRMEAAALFQQVQEEAKQDGYDAGYEDGKRQAYEEQVDTITKAKTLLEEAYDEKQQIISEAEPFLVDLSIEVAKKVIGGELKQSPEQVLEMSKKVLSRSRVHGQITVCVNHHYFDYIQEHRPQLLELLDGQAELSIYPDHTVQDGGCVIRTQLGSVDARVDTQLSEIKQALLEIARGSEMT
ncbi:flagellar assembly protein FliH [Brevibacillus reuszeri]|uniref:Flagellar assembly protein FliH n=1 Tax=Brevibacillus reuszeri TaxID=54915 RepID=A0A0K9YVI6_9BACL|nr:flagellar assembly protein FliH [Brevibacillus reuszeri]KNB72724.1 flagellar assembly protein FliH [Brevibacillus reuszeri]MED1860571.1 flagellar assembly protein FliH [Brevibacillus reuszeri]